MLNLFRKKNHGFNFWKQSETSRNGSNINQLGWIGVKEEILMCCSLEYIYFTFFKIVMIAVPMLNLFRKHPGFYFWKGYESLWLTSTSGSNSNPRMSWSWGKQIVTEVRCLVVLENNFRVFYVLKFVSDISTWICLPRKKTLVLIFEISMSLCD